jgi:hypothetical protein
VVSETSVLVGEGAEIRKKHPDYEFRVGGERLFFVKALKGVGTLRDLKTFVASADSKWDSGLFSMMEEDRLHLSDAVLPGIGDSNDAMKNLFSLPSPVSFAIIGCVSPSKTTLQPITEAFYATSAYAVIQQRRPSLPLSA